jgi:hypothetical protein
MTPSKDLVEGAFYLITEGVGQGESGRCIEVRESGFGMVWGVIQTTTGIYTARWHFLEPFGGYADDSARP